MIYGWEEVLAGIMHSFIIRSIIDSHGTKQSTDQSEVPYTMPNTEQTENISVRSLNI